VLTERNIHDEIGLLLMEADRAGVNRYLKPLPEKCYMWDCPIGDFTALIDISYGAGSGGGPDISLSANDWSGNGLYGDVFLFNDGNAAQPGDLGIVTPEAPDRVTTDAIVAVIAVPIQLYCPAANRFSYLADKNDVGPYNAELLGGGTNQLNDVAYRWYANSSANQATWTASDPSFSDADVCGNVADPGTSATAAGAHYGHQQRDTASNEEQAVAVEFRIVVGSRLACGDGGSNFAQPHRTNADMDVLANRNTGFRKAEADASANLNGLYEDNMIYYKYNIEALRVEKYDNILAQDDVRLFSGVHDNPANVNSFDTDAAGEATTFNNSISAGGATAGASGVDNLVATLSRYDSPFNGQANTQMNWNTEAKLTSLSISRHAISDLIHKNLDISVNGIYFAGEMCDSIDEMRAIINQNYRALNIWGCMSDQSESGNLQADAEKYLECNMKIHDEVIGQPATDPNPGVVGHDANAGGAHLTAVSGGDDDINTQGTNAAVRGWRMHTALIFE